MPVNNEPETTKHTVLIVDDDPVALDILEGHLASEGYNLLLASSGFQALRHLEREQTDLVVLDVMMPHLDGFEVCERIKVNERWRRIPVILITGFWDQEQMDRGIAAGAESFLPKPIDGNELRTQVRLMLEPLE
jgi:CheY-like chemotaxis protein